MTKALSAIAGPCGRGRLLWILSITVALLAGLLPAGAGAHATMRASEPASGAVLQHAPKAVVFRFSERVEGAFGALRVVNERGARVDDGHVFRPGARKDELAIGIRPGTADGAFTAAYRVVSADGHPVTGGTTFLVGEDVTAIPTDLRTLTADQAAPAGIGTALATARVVRYLGIAGATGLLVLLLAVWMPLRRARTESGQADAAFVAAGGRRLRWLAALGAVGAVSALVLQAANAAGTGVVDALDPGVLRDVLATRTGAWLAASAVAFVALAALAPRAFRGRSLRSSRTLIAAVALLAVVVVAPAFGGHAAASSPAWALVPIEILHVAGMGAWVGGLLGLLLVLPRATRALPPGPERTRLLAAVLLRFSPVALGSVALLTVAGTGLSLLQLTTLYDLVDTAYGRAVLIKVVLLLAVISIAVLQREYLVPRLQRAVDGTTTTAAAVAGDTGSGAQAGPASVAVAGRQIRTALRGEALLLVVVLAVTGALAGYPPPRSLASAPASVTRTVGDLQLQVVVDPARVGRNVLHVYAFGRDGQPLASARELRIRAVPPGRAGSSDTPVDVPMVVAGPGHWTAAAVPLGARGTWRLELVLRMSAFDQLEETVPIRVR